MSDFFDSMFSRMRLPRQAMVIFRAEVALDPQRCREVAREVAAEIHVGELTIAPDPAEPDREFQVMKAGAPISTFQLIVSRDLAELGEGEAGRRRLSVQWSGETDARSEKLLSSRRDSVFSLFATLAFTGVPGFPAFESFITAFGERLSTEDPSAKPEVIRP